MIVGVDCGAHGALAVLDTTGAVLNVFDMPGDVVEVNGKKRTRVSAPALATLMADIVRARRSSDESLHMFAEVPTYRPIFTRNKLTGQKEARSAGAAGMGVLGESVGMVRMAAAAFGFAFTPVHPGTWKRVVGCPADKGGSRARASALYPGAADKFRRNKDDGRAEALLIAYYGLLKAR